MWPYSSLLENFDVREFQVTAARDGDTVNF